MNDFDEARREYESIPIPEELPGVVRAAVSTTACKGSKNSMNRKIWMKAVACALGIFLLGGVAALNTVPAFAAAAAELPVIGAVARILTVRQYTEDNGVAGVAVKVPAVDVSGHPGADGVYVEKINALIQSRVDDYLDRAKKDVADYREGFLSTGGTEEEFEAKGIKIEVSYEVKYVSGDVVSFVVTGTQSWASVYGERHFYNLNVADGREVALPELLGQDWTEEAGRQILSQMVERMKADKDVTYTGQPELGEDTVFYIGEGGNPVVVIPKYEISPGFMGDQEFEITR